MYRKDLDLLVCKMNKRGTGINWCSTAGGPLAETMVATGGTGIAFDSHGNIFIAGTTARNVPGDVALGGLDAVAAKFDSNGNLNWIKQFGSRAADVAVAIGVDTYSDVVYLAGNTNGNVPSDYQRGGGDWFLFQLRSANGTRIMSRQYGGPGQDLLTDINVYKQRVFFVGTIPVASGNWVGYWAEGDEPDGPKNTVNSGIRKYYNSELRGGRDVQVCELSRTGPETNVGTDWTMIPTVSTKPLDVLPLIHLTISYLIQGMIQWCSAYGSYGDDGTASMRIYGYNMSFPWTSNGDFQTNEGYGIPTAGGRDVGYTMYWEYVGFLLIALAIKLLTFSLPNRTSRLSVPSRGRAETHQRGSRLAIDARL
jgi:hypothetical protein